MLKGNNHRTDGNKPMPLTPKPRYVEDFLSPCIQIFEGTFHRWGSRNRLQLRKMVYFKRFFSTPLVDFIVLRIGPIAPLMLLMDH